MIQPMPLRWSASTLVAFTAFVVVSADWGPTARRIRAQTPPARIVAIGDVHGAFDAFAGILQSAGLIDAKRQWSGGSAVLVQTGDVFDRGTGVRDALDLLMRLEEDAKRAGGRVEPLLGNHEVMNMLHEVRDVHPAVYAGFADNRSEARQRRAYDDYAGIATRRGGKPPIARDEWTKTHPPGFVEYLEALGPRGKYGRWLRSHKVVTAIAGTGFMHAGIKPDGAPPQTLDDINRLALRELSMWDDTKAAMVQARIVPPFCTLDEAIEAAVDELTRIAAAIKENTAPGDHVTREFVDRLQWLIQIGKSPLLDSDGPLWYRGFAQWSDDDDVKVKAVLDRYAVRRFVTGHTPIMPGRIRSRFANRIFLIDTGMLSTYFKGGRASAIELQGERVTAIYTDAREVLVPSGSARFDRAPLREGAVAGAASARSR
jgi:hypothetical protein